MWTWHNPCCSAFAGPKKVFATRSLVRLIRSCGQAETDSPTQEWQAFNGKHMLLALASLT